MEAIVTIPATLEPVNEVSTGEIEIATNSACSNINTVAETSNKNVDHIEKMCHNLKEMLKSHIGAADTDILRNIQQQFLKPIEPSILAMKKKPLKFNECKNSIIRGNIEKQQLFSTRRKSEKVNYTFSILLCA